MEKRNERILEVNGKTVDEAVQRALRELNLSRAQVEVKVLAEGRTGIFGVGGTPATVRVAPIGVNIDANTSIDQEPLLQIDDYADYQEIGQSDVGHRGQRQQRNSSRQRNPDGRNRGNRRPTGRTTPQQPGPFSLLADPEFEAEGDPTEHAVNVLTDLIHLIGIGAVVSAREPETPMDGLEHAQAVLDVKPARPNDDLGRLIGWRGANLAALQYTVNLIINRSLEGQHAFTVDVDGYKRRREASLNSLTQKSADHVRETEESVDLEPMSPAERRIVHIALADDPVIFTESLGQGDARHVRIVYGGEK